MYLQDNIIYETNNNITACDIFNRNKFDFNDITKNNIFSLHIQLRTFDEIIIKDYYSWNLESENTKYNLKKLILDKNYSNFINNTHGLRLNYIINNSCKKIDNINLNIKEKNSLNTNKFNKIIINKLLDTLNISLDEYNNFINILYEKIKNKFKK